jgi:hypothetical protein
MPTIQQLIRQTAPAKRKYSQNIHLQEFAEAWRLYAFAHQLKK